MFVGRRMKRDLVTVPPGATLEEAARLLKGNRIHHLPVVEGGRLLGIVTDTDLRNATFRAAAEEGRGAPGTVEEIMTRDVVTLSPGDTIDDAMLVLSRERFGALPVVDAGRLAGIVTKADILTALLETLDIEGVGVRLEVLLPREMGEVTRLASVLGKLAVDVRSLVLAPHGGDGYAAFVRVATIDVGYLKGRLREAGFKVPEIAEFLE